MKTNEKRLVKISVEGEIAPPVHGTSPYIIHAAYGKPVSVPMVGGITYNVKIGDSAVNWVGDHIEPCVSVRIPDSRKGRAKQALSRFACVGNEAKVVSGDAKGEKGIVVGKHGGIEHTMIHFSKKSALNKMSIGDKVQIKAFGMGLESPDFPTISFFNIDPRLLEKMGIKGEKGILHVPVTHFVPSAIMGSGLGQADVYSGDYDIQMFDPVMVGKYKLKSLKLGAFVAILNTDHRYGRIYRTNYVSIGIVVHSSSSIAGHGPGVMSVATGPDKHLIPVIDAKAHLAEIFKKKTKKK